MLFPFSFGLLEHSLDFIELEDAVIVGIVPVEGFLSLLFELLFSHGEWYIFSVLMVGMRSVFSMYVFFFGVAASHELKINNLTIFISFDLCFVLSVLFGSCLFVGFVWFERGTENAFDCCDFGFKFSLFEVSKVSVGAVLGDSSMRILIGLDLWYFGNHFHDGGQFGEFFHLMREE